MGALGRMSSLGRLRLGLRGHIDLGSNPSPALLCCMTLATSPHGCPVLLFLNSAPTEQPSFASQHTMVIPHQNLWSCCFSCLNTFPCMVPFHPSGVSSERPPQVTFLEQPSFLPLLIPCPYFISFPACLTYHLALFYRLLVHHVSPAVSFLKPGVGSLLFIALSLVLGH